MDLTKRQQEIFDFIKRYSAKYGYPPTVRDIGKAVGLASSSTVHAHLANLEKVGLLRRDLQHRGELEKYEARVARIEQKLSAIATRISESDPVLAKALRTAWQLPARSLAFRNADHLKKADE